MRRGRSRIAIGVLGARELPRPAIDGRASVQVRARSHGAAEPRRADVRVARVRAFGRRATMRVHVRAIRRTHLTRRAAEIDAARCGSAVASLVVTALAGSARRVRATRRADRAGSVADARTVLRRDADESRAAVGVRRALLRRGKARAATAGNVRVRARRKHRAVALGATPRNTRRDRRCARALRKSHDHSSSGTRLACNARSAARHSSHTARTARRSAARRGAARPVASGASPRRAARVVPAGAPSRSTSGAGPTGSASARTRSGAARLGHAAVLRRRRVERLAAACDEPDGQTDPGPHSNP